MIQFKCGGCHANLQIGDEWAGKLGNCCYCGVNSPVPGNSPAPSYPKRSSRIKIIARFIAWPLAVLTFWVIVVNVGGVSGLMWPILIGGLGGLVGLVFYCWAFMNIVMWIWCPREMKLWKKGGGDPFFDTLPEAFNPDPPEVRFQELFLERARLEEEGHNFD